MVHVHGRKGGVTEAMTAALDAAFHACRSPDAEESCSPHQDFHGVATASDPVNYSD